MKTEDRRPKAEGRGRTAIWAAIIVVAGVIAYANSFGAPFELDDFGSVVDNSTIQHLGRLGEVLSPPRDSGITVNGRPLLNLSFAINYAISGYNVWSYHLFNLGIHLAGALALFGIVRRTLASNRQSEIGIRQSNAVAFGAAIIWLLHPLQTEAVTYVVQRAESLVSLFFLLTIYCFVRATDETPSFAKPSAVAQPMAGGPWGKKAGRWLALSVASCFFGMATKEVMVGAPIIVLLFDRTFLAGTFREAIRRRAGYYCSLAATWLLLGWLVLHASGRGGTAGASDQVIWWQYAFTQCRAVVHYLRLIFWPVSLVFDYGIGVQRDFGPIALQALLLAALVAATLYALWKYPVAGFFGAVFFIVLAPSSSVVPVVTQTMAEHRVYLALAAIAIPAVLLLHRLLGSRAILVIAAIAAVLGFATIRRNGDYRSALALWTDTVAKYPSSARAQNNLGATLLQLNRVDEAVPLLEEAIRIRPEYLRARSNLAQALQRTGDTAGALAQYLEMLKIHPDPEGHMLVGRMLEQDGRRADSITHYREAVRLNPNSAESHDALGNALLREGQAPEAISEYRAAVAANPGDAAAFSNLGSALGFVGQLDDAAAADERALQLNPAGTNARVGLALVRARQNRVDEAMQLLTQVLAENPDNAVARSALEELRQRKGR